MLTWEQGIILAVLQGFAELFPISSLGHTVILPALLGWGAVQRQPTFLPFIVLLHLATAAALLLFYRGQWVAMGRAFLTSAFRGRLSHTPEEHMAWLLFFGTIPAGLIGFLLEGFLKELFGTPLVAAVFLAVNGGLMLATEHLRRRGAVARATTAVSIAGTTTGSHHSDHTNPAGVTSDRPVRRRQRIADLSWRDAIIIGSAQALALIPGISRSGVTISAGLLIGMQHDEAAHYAFLLATPLIVAASLLEVPVLFTAGAEALLLALVGAVVAGVTAYLSVRFLTRYFRLGRLDPFAYYCVGAGLASIGYLLIRPA